MFIRPDASFIFMNFDIDDKKICWEVAGIYMRT